MPDYKVSIVLGNDDTAEYLVSNGAVSPRDVPSEYTTQAWVLVNKVLTDWILLMISAGFKKLEIERE